MLTDYDCSHDPFCVTVLCGPAQVVQHDVVVAPAQHPALHQAELLPGRQLPLAGVAGEAGQVVDAAPRPPHPVAGVHLPATLGTFSPKPTVRDEDSVRHFLLKHVNCC